MKIENKENWKEIELMHMKRRKKYNEMKKIILTQTLWTTIILILLLHNQ